MRFILLGHDCFAGPLRALGHEALTVGLSPDCDVTVPQLDMDWDQLQKLLPDKGQGYDVIVVTDNLGCRDLPTGLWAAQQTTVFYGIDAPINYFWHKHYSQLFDVVFLDQKPQVKTLAKYRQAVHWLPVAVDTELYANPQPGPAQPGVCFVGVVNDDVRPKRSAVLNKVSARFPLHCAGGRRDQWLDTASAAALYRQYQVSLNENLFPGLTTRPLEIMASGGCLLTEAAPGQMDEYFIDGQDLYFFDPDTLEARLERLLRDEDLNARLRKNGRDKVMAEHGFLQRARQMIRVLESSLGQPRRVRDQQALAQEALSLLMAAWRWPRAPQSQAVRRLLRANGRLRAVSALYPLAAGLAALSAGQGGQALPFLAAAAADGQPLHLWIYAYGLYTQGQAKPARQIWKSKLGLKGQPDQAPFHLAAARFLRDLGQELCPGFNRLDLWPGLWTALEHFRHALSLDPNNPTAWEELGDVLLKREAPNAAEHCFGRAYALNKSEAMAQKQSIAAHRGYLS